MKKYKIVFSPKALNDIEEAVNYYNELSPGLGNRFLTDFNLIYKAIDLNPLFASVKYDDVRVAGLKKFPFSIHYNVNKINQVVTIVAVFNTWKEPFW